MGRAEKIGVIKSRTATMPKSWVSWAGTNSSQPSLGGASPAISKASQGGSATKIRRR